MKFYLEHHRDTGEILCVTPVQDPLSVNEYFEITEETAGKFIMGELLADNWFVVGSTDKKLVANTIDLSPDDAGTFIPLTSTNSLAYLKRAVGVTLYSGSNTFEVMIPTEFVGTKLVHVTDETLKFTITKKNDPSNVVASMEVDVKELMSKGVYRQAFKTSIKDLAVYTRKAFSNYNLAFSEAKWINTQNRTGRINQLVAYQAIKKESQASMGILAIHRINTGTLELRIINEDEPIFKPGSSKSFLFLTKADDPTVLVSTIKFNFETLIEKRAIYITLPEGVGKDFGLSGFPICDSMAFLRKK